MTRSTVGPAGSPSSSKQTSTVPTRANRSSMAGGTPRGGERLRGRACGSTPSRVVVVGGHGSTPSRVSVVGPAKTARYGGPVLGLLYDVHGNLAALEAVVADARGRGVDEWLVGGDVAAFGGWPEETIDALRALEPARWIRGNHERWAVEQDQVPAQPLPIGAAAALRGALDDDLVEELYALPTSVEIPGGEAWHASPVSDVEGFAPHPAPGDRDLLGDRTPGLLVVGHTHVPVHRPVERADGGTTVVVNPGSVGLPFDGDPRSAYGLLHDDGRIELRRIDYDVEQAVARQHERWGVDGWSAIVADTLASGRPGA